MADPELEAIRAARLAQLRGSAQNGAYALTAPSGGIPAGLGKPDAGGADQTDALAQQEELKRQMLTQILDADARERCTYEAYQCRASRS